MLELLPVSDILSIPDDKRAGRFNLFDKPGRSWFDWCIFLVVLVLNGWFDYYHPLGILLDIIFVIVFVIVWVVKSDSASQNE